MALVPDKNTDPKDHAEYKKNPEKFLEKRAAEEVNATTEEKKNQGDKNRR